MKPPWAHPGAFPIRRISAASRWRLKIERYTNLPRIRKRGEGRSKSHVRCVWLRSKIRLVSCGDAAIASLAVELK